MIVSSIDYGNLSFAISNAIWNENASTILKSFPSLRDYIVDRFTYGSELDSKRTLLFNMMIPGNLTTALYIIDVNDPRRQEEITGRYRINGQLSQVIAMDLSIVRNPSVTIDKLGGFFSSFYSSINEVFRDENLKFVETTIFAYFTTFSMIYYKYRLSKEDYVEMQKYMRKDIGPIKMDNLIYENFISLIYSRNCSEASILCCMEEGINGRVPSNISKSKIMPKVQQGSN